MPNSSSWMPPRERRGVELRLVALGLLAVMRPVVGDAGHDVLRAGGWLCLQLSQYLVFEVVVLEVGAGQ